MSPTPTPWARGSPTSGTIHSLCILRVRLDRGHSPAYLQSRQRAAQSTRPRGQPTPHSTGALLGERRPTHREGQETFGCIPFY